MRSERDQPWTTPVGAPYYPPLPAVYRNVKFQLLLFTPPPGATARYLPEGLEPLPDGRCVAGGIDVPFCTAYGAFREALVLIECSFRGRRGFYCSHVFHTGPAGIAAGREIYGTPKVFADVTIAPVERAVVTEARLAGSPVLALSTVPDAIIEPADLPVLTPAWRLKLIPRADGPGPALMQLIDCSRTTRDQTIHFAARASGVVQFAPSPTLDLTPLGPVECGPAYYFETSYSEHYAEVAYDYLDRAPEPSSLTRKKRPPRRARP
jgi:acetoacetate decarboxylase